nr:MAG TPA: hypothetical protein [Caudoviricetes sp.]
MRNVSKTNGLATTPPPTRIKSLPGWGKPNE